MTDRHILPNIEESLELFPAVLLNGARQVGKSTLAKQLVRENKIDRYVTLDDITSLEAAKEDPHGFINQFSSSVVIDEVQRVPNLILAAKKNIDEKKAPGKFLFTGSANILSYPNVRDSLAGRMDIISLEGFSINEIMQKKKSCLLNILLNAENTDKVAQDLFSKVKAIAKLSTKQLEELMFFGSFPDVALKKNSTYRSKWFSSYITAYVEKDIRDLSKFLDVLSFSKLIRLIGVRTGSLLNNKNLSVSIGLDQRTIARYIELLEISFQARLLQPWSSNLSKHHVKTPKIFMNDAGLASYFLGINDINQLKDHPNYGNLLETWMFSELRKSLVYHESAKIFFYRNHKGVEVDFIITQGNTTLGIECKASSVVTAKDYKNLNAIEGEFKNNFLGIILYTGEEVLKLDKNIIAVPIKSLLCSD